MPDTGVVSENIPEYRTEIRIWTQEENDVALTKRRHRNSAAMKVVLIPKAKPDTGSETPGNIPHLLARIFEGHQSRNLLQHIPRKYFLGFKEHRDPLIFL
ncbi:hypothetical protein Tco_1163409 [Tanacetum coccineum]